MYTHINADCVTYIFFLSLHIKHINLNNTKYSLYHLVYILYTLYHTAYILYRPVYTLYCPVYTEIDNIYMTLFKMLKSTILNRLFLYPGGKIQPNFLLTRYGRQYFSTVDSTQNLYNQVLALGIPGRYSVALHKACIKSKCADAVYNDLESLKMASETCTDFRAFLKTPGFTLDTKQQVIMDIGKRFKLNTLTINLLNTLAENKRLFTLPKIFDVFEKLHRHTKGEIKCSVQSAKDLSSSEQKQVINALQQRVGSNAKLIVDFTTSPSIMGGLLVRLGDETLDFSVISRLEQLKNQLGAAVQQ